MSNLLVGVLQLAMLVFIARALLSWIPIRPDSAFAPVSNVIHQLTEPVLLPVRRMLPSTGPVDFSVFAVIVFISFVLTPIARAL